MLCTSVILGFQIFLTQSAVTWRGMDAVRGPYSKNPDSVRARVVESYQSGGDWQTVAEHNGVKYKTAYSWVHTEEPRKTATKRGGLKTKILQDEEVAVVVEWIAENPTITLKEVLMHCLRQFKSYLICSIYCQIRVRIAQTFLKDVSVSTVGNYLDGRLITCKLVRLIPENVNCMANKEKRREYVEKALQFEAQLKIFVWIDETNFNLHCNRTFGRAVKGRRARTTVTNSQGRNLHVLGAMTATNFVHCTLKRGSHTCETANEWLRGLLDILLDTYSVGELVIVCDNAPCHRQLESVLQEEDYLGAQLLRLGPYSPFLNPIEGVWSVFKSKVKSDMRTGYNNMMAGDPAGQLSQQEWRMRFLENVAQSAMQAITPQVCANFSAHVRQHYVAALNMEDIRV